MTAQTPDQIAANWAQRLGSSTDKITAGVQAVTTSPGQAAARNADLWVQRTTASKPKWQKNTAAVSLADWQSDMVNKGIPRIATGASAAQSKFSSFMGNLLTYQKQLAGTLPPKGDLNANLNRMMVWATGMSKFSNGNK